ncbi:helicase-related protein [Chloroflexota bacterium]
MRDQLFDFLKKELIGPDPVSPFVQENGEEILTNEPPRLRYGAGILFPQASTAQDIDITDGKENSLLHESVEPVQNEPPLAEIEGENRSLGDVDDTTDANDDIINLANAYLPSVMGFSCYLKMPEEGLLVSIRAGRYIQKDFVTEKENSKVVKPAYFRESLDTIIHITAKGLPSANDRSRNYEITKNNQATGLALNITNRTAGSAEDAQRQLYTFALINNLKSSKGHIDNDSCFFQVEFSVKAKEKIACFSPYPEKIRSLNIDDEKSTQLLYRNHRTYAVGHGCAPFWDENGQGNAFEISANVLPLYEMKPIIPVQFSDLQLKMYDMSDKGDQSQLTSRLILLCDRYEDWTNKQSKFAQSELTGEYRQTAERHIQNCKNCLMRMRDGIKLIESDADIRRAFGLMNRSMLNQQIHYGLKLREWRAGTDGVPVIAPIKEPDIETPETWPDWSEAEKRNIRLGTWYPFQIAFILMNLRSIARPEAEERKMVDLIWFPTGGGKTEAYLGLAAFTIFFRRLKNSDDSGTTVLMRYTLRLLTAQQYQRAASLICACELIRSEHETELGKGRITIGLWVGAGLTSNSRSDAIKALDKLSRGESKDNPFIMLKCPWCGAKMGPVHAGRLRIMGYRKTRQPSTVIFQCSNTACAFSKDDFNLPLQVIDEDIYECPDSIIIGTVDKFAMLPWRPEARSLFGFRKDTRVTPPELIIQDELHLISGPLGSMAGHYETFIYELCKNKIQSDNNTGPKIIASTATITRASDQIHALYGCGTENVSLFPAQCIDAGDSFFAQIDNESEGRIFAGVHASGLPSHTTAQVRVLAALLQGVKSAIVGEEKERDPYWTNVVYFNSLRELGHAATLIQADIREYLNAVWVRKGIRKEDKVDNRRFINRAIELTSRISSTEIPETLQALEINYPIKEGIYPMDICLATNMISVGVDVQRLGLMTVIGQPKTTSEYIQATSRVGRSKEGPGFIVTIFNTAKPRDRSHYEHFYTYHSSIYSRVEPTSVTPFSSPVRERALHAVLVGLVRYFGSDENRSSPQPLPPRELLDNIKVIVSDRTANIDPDELELTLKLLEERIDEWSRYLPPKYGGFYMQSGELPLMYPAGTSPLEEWDMKSWPTPTSMRNVDASCDAAVISRYLSYEETD